MFAGLKRRVSDNFVVLMEMVGYVMSAAILVGVLYSLFVKVEILAHANGVVRPESDIVAAPDEVLLLRYLAPSGENVIAGQPVCQVVVETAAKDALVAKRKLSAVATLLQTREDSKLDAVLTNVREALGDLPADVGAETLSAPRAGILQHAVESGADVPAPAGDPLALVHDMTRLRIEGVLESLNAEKVAEGQQVRLTIDPIAEPFMGYVAAVSRSGETRQVLLQFQDVPEAVQHHFHKLLFDAETPSALPAVRAAIIVGHRSLFRQMFGRR